MTDLMEKRNVVEEKRTPDHERERRDENWDKEAADTFATGKLVKRDEPALRTTTIKRD